MTNFNTYRLATVLFSMTFMAMFQFISSIDVFSQSCTDSTGTFGVLHGMPDLGGGITGAWPVLDCTTPKAPYFSFTFSGIIPDNLYGNYCNGHSVPDSLDIWISRTGTADPDPCASCATRVNLWHWDASQTKWINNYPPINGSGNGSLTMSLPTIAADCSDSTCLWIFTGKRGSGYCAQRSNDCFNRGTISWARTCP